MRTAIKLYEDLRKADRRLTEAFHSGANDARIAYLTERTNEIRTEWLEAEERELLDCSQPQAMSRDKNVT